MSARTLGIVAVARLNCVLARFVAFQILPSTVENESSTGNIMSPIPCSSFLDSSPGVKVTCERAVYGATGHKDMRAAIGRRGIRDGPLVLDPMRSVREAADLTATISGHVSAAAILPGSVCHFTCGDGFLNTGTYQLIAFPERMSLLRHHESLL